MKFKIFLLAAANLCAIILVFYFLEFLGISPLYGRVKRMVQGDNKPVTVSPIEDMALLEKAEQEKIMESLIIRETELQMKMNAFALAEKQLKGDQDSLDEEKDELQNRLDKLEQMEKEKVAYELKVTQMAEKFANMPPEKSVERIVSLDDDLLILDVLTAVDGYFEGRGQASLTPLYYSLMDKEVASRLMRKSTISE